MRLIKYLLSIELNTERYAPEGGHMAWLWNSWEEYTASVHPHEIRVGHFKQSRIDTVFQAGQDLLNAANTLTGSLNQLREAGFVAGKRGYSEAAGKHLDLLTTVAQMIRAGEQLLLYHKRLALSQASYGFLHINDLLEHWDRYKGTDRIYFEIQQLMKDTGELLDGYRQMSHEDESLILGRLDLPESLEHDFRLSRDLFSVGFEEIGLLVAGRGLEGVLREIAHKKRIKFEIKGKTTPASEADFFDLIELMSRIRWTADGALLVSPDIKALLHYLRVIRNSGAHPSRAGRGVQDFRETGNLAVRQRTRESSDDSFSFELAPWSGEQDTLQSIALTIFHTCAYLLVGPRKGIAYILFGQPIPPSLGEYWSGRPHIHLIRFEEQLETAKENEVRHRSEFAQIIARVWSPDVAATQHLPNDARLSVRSSKSC
jgi:hypothetical protein